MKRKIVILGLLMIFVASLFGCGSEKTTVSAPLESSAIEEKTDEEEPAEPTVIDYDNRMLCSDDKVDVALKDIHYGGITLTITSKTSEILTLSCDGLAFDGNVFIMEAFLF